MPLPGITDFVNDGDRLRIDLATGDAQNETTGERRRFPSVPQLVRDILQAGNALDWALARVAKRARCLDVSAMLRCGTSDRSE